MLALHHAAQPDEHYGDVGDTDLEVERGRNRHMRAVVAPHAIDGDSDQRDYSPLSRTTFLPR